MPLIATCQRCTARFVVDEAANNGSRAARAAPSRCEECRREALERAVPKSREWVKSTGVIALVFLVLAGASLQKLKRHDDLEWAGQLGVAVISALLAAFFYFRRLRPQLQQHKAAEWLDLISGESADMRRWRRLKKLGEINHESEARVLRKRLESSLERSVALGLESSGNLREHRRRSRLLDQIAIVDRQVHGLESQSDDLGKPFPDDLDRLHVRRARLCEQLERPPVWPRVARRLVSQGFFCLCWLPVTLLAWELFRAAWRQGNILLITVTVAGILMPMVYRLWLERPTRALIASPPGPTEETPS